MTKPICLVGEALGANEERIKSSFVGASGVELLRMMSQATLITLTAEDHNFLSQFFGKPSNPQMVEMVWKMHPEVHRTNVFNLHPPSNDIWIRPVDQKQRPSRRGTLHFHPKESSFARSSPLNWTALLTSVLALILILSSASAILLFGLWLALLVFQSLGALHVLALIALLASKASSYLSIPAADPQTVGTPTNSNRRLHQSLPRSTVPRDTPPRA